MGKVPQVPLSDGINQGKLVALAFKQTHKEYIKWKYLLN
jgi:hypothetical protein